MDDKKNTQHKIKEQAASAGESRNAAADGEADASREKNDVKNAHEQAERDIESDAELGAHSPNDDLDEGETARLGEGPNPVI